jgi:hypothetical protein
MSQGRAQSIANQKCGGRRRTHKHTGAESKLCSFDRPVCVRLEFHPQRWNRLTHPTLLVLLILAAAVLRVQTDTNAAHFAHKMCHFLMRSRIAARVHQNGYYLCERAIDAERVWVTWRRRCAACTCVKRREPILISLQSAAARERAPAKRALRQSLETCVCQPAHRLKL